MKKKFNVVLILLFVGLSLNAQTPVKVKVKVNEHFHSGSFGGNHVPGTWTAYIEDQKVYIQFTGEDWDSGRTFSLAELGTLPRANEGAFTVAREAGTITFKGEFAGGKGHGFYTFAENPSFKSYLEGKGFSGLDKELMLHIFLTDINKNYFEFLKVNSYVKITNDQLKDLAY